MAAHAAPKAGRSTPSQMFETTGDGDVVIGRVRPKNNPLIHRGEVGKPSFHNDLPELPNDYTFGAPLKRDAEGAGDVMLTWQSHAPAQSKMTYDFGRDFLTLNKKSVGSNCVSAKDSSDFRKGHDARIKPKVTGKKPLIAPPSVTSNPHHVFGSHSGESESVADLIQNRWELQWVAEQKKRMETLERAQQKEQQRSASRKRQAAKSPNLEKKVATPHPKETFTLPKFKNVPSRFAAGSPAPAAH